MQGGKSVSDRFAGLSERLFSCSFVNTRPAPYGPDAARRWDANE